MGKVLEPDDYRRAAGSAEFAAYLRRARVQFLRGEATTVGELRRVYRRAAASVRADLENLTSGTLRHGYLSALATRLDDRARALNRETLQAIQQGIRLAVIAGGRGPEQITQRLLGGVFPEPEVRALFVNVNERAVSALLARTGRDGLKLSDRVWRAGEQWRNNARTVIEDAVARGQDARVTARQLEQYLNPGVATPLKAETRRRLAVAKDVSMPALRLAVTETNNAFREATVMASQAAPGYHGIIWRLSAAHVLTDLCDEYAAHNGNGFWPMGQEPTSPHPWCRCVCLPSYEDSAAFMARLTQWINDPSSQPDLEEWHQTTGRQFFHRPRATFAMPGSGDGPVPPTGPGRAGGIEVRSGGVGGGSPEAGAGGGGRGASMPPIGIGGGAGGSSSDDRLWLAELVADVGQTGRSVTDLEVDRMRRVVALAGFYPQQNVKPNRLWLGKSLPRGVVQPGMLLDAAEAHFLKHVEEDQQWPQKTSLSAYLGSLRGVVLDPQGFILLSQFSSGHFWQIAFIGPSKTWQGVGGANWIMIEYRVGLGHWVTGYQSDISPDAIAQSSQRLHARWIRRLSTGH